MDPQQQQADDPTLRLRYYQETGQTAEAKQYETYLRETGQLKGAAHEPPQEEQPGLASRVVSKVGQGIRGMLHPLDMAKGIDRDLVTLADVVAPESWRHGRAQPGPREALGAGARTVTTLGFPGIAGGVAGRLGGGTLAKAAGLATAGGAAGVAGDPSDPVASGLAGAGLAAGMGGAMHGAGKVAGPALGLGADFIGKRPMENKLGMEGLRSRAQRDLGARAQMDESAGYVAEPMHPSVPPLALDRAGPNVEGRAEGIATRPGPGRADLTRAVGERAKGMRPAISQAFDEATGMTSAEGEALMRQLEEAQSSEASAQGVAKAVGQEESAARPVSQMSPHQAWTQEHGDHPAAIQTLRAMSQAAKAEADRLYGEARAQPQTQRASSPTLDSFHETPVGKLARAWATAQLKNHDRLVPKPIQVDGSASLGEIADGGSGPFKPPTSVAEPKPPPLDPSHKASPKTLNLASLDDLKNALRATQGIIDKEEGKANGGWSAMDENIGEGRGGGTLGGGMAKKRRNYGVQRAETIEEIMQRKHGLSPEEIEEIRFGSPSDTPVTDEAPPLAEIVPPSKGGSGGGAPPPAGADEGGVHEEDVTSPEMLHLEKQYVAKLARMGVHDGAQGTLAVQAHGALSQWGKVKGEMASDALWNKADEATAAHFRLLDALNAGRNIMRSQMSPGGAPRRALAQSLSGVAERMAQGSPAEQQAFQVGAKSAVAEHLRSAGPKMTLAKLRDPQSDLSQRIALATGDPQAASRVAARLEAQPQQIPGAPPERPLSRELQGTERGLRTMKTKTASEDPSQSLAVLSRDKAAMGTDELRGLQRGSAQSVRGKWAASGRSVKSPGRVFDFESPERAEQLSHAMKSPEAGEQFKSAVGSWDRVEAQRERVLGNSRTGLRGAEGSGAASISAGSVLHGPRAIGRQILTKLGGAAREQQRQRFEGEIARILTGKDPETVPSLLDQIKRGPMKKRSGAPTTVAGGYGSRAMQHKDEE